MTIPLWFLAGIGLSGLAFVLFELRDAPEGYEDEEGFHYALWRNNRPGVSDISCIWATRSGNTPFPGGGGLRRAA